MGLGVSRRLLKWAIIALLTLLLLGALRVSAESVDVKVEFEPRAVKVKGLILPGDIVDVSVQVTATQFEGNVVKVAYRVYCSKGLVVEVAGEGGLTVNLVERRGSASFSLEIPWCKGLVVEVTSIEPSGGFSRAAIDLGPEVKVSLLEPRDPFLGERREGGYLIVKVLTRANVEGEVGLLVVRDETLGLTLLERSVEIADGRVHELYIKVPENPRRLWVFKDLNMLHRISIEYMGVDSYSGNNITHLYVIVVSSDLWRIPWAASLALGFLVILVIASYITRRLYSS